MMNSAAHLLLIDNYDSFTYNLVHALEASGRCAVTVKRCDEVPAGAILSHDAAVISPGPGLPSELPNLTQRTAEACASGKPVLGICLGFQAMALDFGARLKNLAQVHHGVSHTVVREENHEMFKDLPEKFTAGRYHSWVVESGTLPSSWSVTCRDEAGEIMAAAHRRLPLWGFQFHPESVLTPEGRWMLENFLNSVIAGREVQPLVQAAG